MLESHSPVQMNYSPSPVLVSPPRSISIGQLNSCEYLSNCQEPSKKKRVFSKAKTNLVSQSTNLTVLFSKPNNISNSVQNSQLNNNKIIPRSKSRASIIAINLARVQNIDLKNIFKLPEKKNHKMYIRNGSVKINQKFQITANKKENKSFWTNEKILVNCAQNYNFDRVFTTSFPANRLKKGKKGSKEVKEKPIVFPELQTPIRNAKKNDEDCRFFNKSFSDLKDLPLYRLSIENNMFSKLRKYKGKLK